MGTNWAVVAWGCFALTCSVVMFVFGERLRKANLPRLSEGNRRWQTKGNTIFTAFGFLAMGIAGIVLGVAFPEALDQ